MTDYIEGHLAWIKNNPKFQPKYVSSYGYDYYEIMRELYTVQRVIRKYDVCEHICTYKENPFIQDFAKKQWIADKAWHKASNALSKAIDKEVEKLEPTPNGMWFVTIGFNHQTWNVKDCCKAIQKILEMDWIISAKANFELHRENGEHPHVHFLIETKEPKSRILDKLSRPLYVKKVVLSKNFIDIKPALDYHHKYINLDKQTDKQEFVEKDRVWRLKENIPDYEKNWK